jgi:hypothetical protein
MQIAVIIVTTVASLAMVQTAQAVTSKLSGKYAFQSVDLCEAKLTAPLTTVLAPPAGSPTTTQVVKSVNTIKSGLMSVSVGYVTFNPSTATSGSLNVSSRVVEGGAVRVGTSGFAMNSHNDSFAGTWSINSDTDPTTVTVTPTGGSAMTFTLAYANLVSGVAQTAYLVRRDPTNGDNNPNCLNSIHATRQAPVT